MERLIDKIESSLAQILRRNELPSVDLIDTIATAKVKCIETSIELCFRLKNEAPEALPVATQPDPAA